MTSLAVPNTSAANPSSPVPLDTIPISPADGNAPDENTSSNGVSEKQEYKEPEQITVFHDPENFNVKHPLIHQWTLWFTKPPSGKVCKENRQKNNYTNLSLRETTGMIC